MTTTARVQAGRLADLHRRKRAGMAEFLLALAEFDEQRGWLALGYSSLFSFLHRELALSRGAAHYRKVGAGLVRRFPEIVEPLRDGRLCITGVIEAAKVLTAENRHDALPKFFRRSKRDAVALAAALRPAAVQPVEPGSAAVQPVEPGSVAVQPVEPSSAAVQPDEPGSAPVQPVELPGAGASSAAIARARESAEPLTADLSRFHVTVSRRFLDKLEAARATLSPGQHGASARSVLEGGLDLLLEHHAARSAPVEAPHPASVAAESGRANPAPSERAAWDIPGGRPTPPWLS
ncbi:MAG TPA: HNH endonuclease [Myxococcales bacterium]